MDEYLKLGHTKKVETPDDHIPHYIPHQVVFMDSSLITMVRIVFDTSCKTSFGY